MSDTQFSGIRSPFSISGRSLRSAFTRVALVATLTASSLLALASPAGASSTYNLSIIAGFGTSGLPTAGGLATSSKLVHPWAVALDSSGNIYIGEKIDGLIEEVNAATGDLSIVAGTGTIGAPTNGALATSSKIGAVGDLAIDSAGNIFFSDSTNNEIDEIDATTHDLSIIAGTGFAGAPIPGPATSSRFNSPIGIALDSSDDIFVADSANAYIEEIDATTHDLSIVAGNGSWTEATNGFASGSVGYVSGIAVDDSGDLYVADYFNSDIMKVQLGSQPSDSPLTVFTSASLFEPANMVLDNDGNLVIAGDQTNNVLSLDWDTGVISAIAGTGVAGQETPGPALSSPMRHAFGVAVDPDGAIYVADANSYVVAKLTPSMSSQIISLSPASTATGYGDSVALSTSDTSGSGAISYNVVSDGGSGCSVDANGNVTAIAPGLCTITATIAADSSFTSATSSSVTVDFTSTGTAAQTVSLSPGSTTIGFGQDLALSLSGVVGSGVIKYGVVSTGGSGCAVTSQGIVGATAPGTCTVNAAISGDPHYAPAGSNDVTIQFTSKGTSLQNLSLAPSATTTGYGDVVHLTSSGASGLGALAYHVVSDGGSGCVVSSAGVVSATSPGTCTLSASIAADPAYAPATSNTVAVTFTSTGVTTQTLALTSKSGTAASNASVALSTSGQSGNGTVSFHLVSDGGSGCVVSTGGVVSATSPGICTLSASIAADPAYAPATSNTVAVTFTTPVPTHFASVVVHFDRGSSQSTDSVTTALIQRTATLIKQGHDTRVSVTGYSKDEGSRSLNSTISLQRAQWVASVLESDLKQLGVTGVVVHVHDGGRLSSSSNEAVDRVVRING